MEGFICPECKESFQTAGLLENHFTSHFEGPSIKCKRELFVCHNHQKKLDRARAMKFHGKI